MLVVDVEKGRGVCHAARAWGPLAKGRSSEQHMPASTRRGAVVRNLRRVCMGAGNEFVVGHDLLADPAVRASALAAIESELPVVGAQGVLQGGCWGQAGPHPCLSTGWVGGTMAAPTKVQQG